MSVELGPARMKVKPVTRARWSDFETLFENPGGPKYCWCMAFRKTREETKELAVITAADKEAGRPSPGRAARKAAIKGRIDKDVPVGLLAYEGDTPVAWCSIAPRQSFRGLGGPKDHADDPDTVWSIACFFVTRPWRGHGVMGALIEAACAYAAKKGATLVEAYPVAEDAPSYRFMGFVPAFAAHDFEKVGTAGNRRTVMRRAVGK